MQTQVTAFRASTRSSSVISAVASVLVSTCLLATVLAAFDTLADQTHTVAVDSSRHAAARG